MATAPKYSDEELLTAKELLASFTPSYRAALFAAAAAPGFDDIAVHCQQAGCQFLNPLPEPVRVDDRAVARVQRGPAPHDQLYAMLLPGVDESRVQPGDVLFLRPLMVDEAMVYRASTAYDRWMIDHRPGQENAWQEAMRDAVTAAIAGKEKK